jgi:hypothetical protein
MAFSPSSIVKTAPHFGHFTFVSLLAIPWHPKENAAKKANANTKLVTFFTPLHLLSFVKYFQNKPEQKNSALLIRIEMEKRFKFPLPLSVNTKLTKVNFLVKEKMKLHDPMENLAKPQVRPSRKSRVLRRGKIIAPTKFPCYRNIKNIPRKASPGSWEGKLQDKGQVEGQRIEG